MLDILELERILVDTIVAHVPSFTEQNIALMPYNAAELEAPFMGIQTLDLPRVMREIEGPVDEITGDRDVTQHYHWRVRFRAIGANDSSTKMLTTSALALMQELAIRLNSHSMYYDLHLEKISIIKMGQVKRVPILKDNEWEDQAYLDVVFGIADKITDNVSYIETVDGPQGSYKRHPDDPNPITTP